MTIIKKVALVGTGVIGASWASLFLSKGLDVVACDPAPEAEARLRATVARQWPTVQQLGMAGSASQTRLSFVTTPEEAVAEADFVQENATSIGASTARRVRRWCSPPAPPGC